MEAFGAAYAEFYDTIYHDKDYAAECDRLERVFEGYGMVPVRNVLDLGCGTGRHAELLAERGYGVVGVDVSPFMISRARDRAKARHSLNPPVYHVADLREFRIKQQFDAVVMMFAVLGYQLEDEDVHAALRTARLHLRPGGLLLFDVWYGPAVLHQRPSKRAKRVEGADGPLTRTSRSTLDRDRQRINVRFHVERGTGADARQTDEDHCLRFFFAADIERFLSAADLALIRIGAFEDFDRDPDESTWNVLVAARAAETKPSPNPLPKGEGVLSVPNDWHIPS